jgi:hypothetical protein
MELTINEQKYPVKFGLAAIRGFCRERKIDFPEFQKIFGKVDMNGITLDTIDNVALLISHGIRQGLRAEKRPFDYDLEFDDIIDLLEDENQLTAVFDEFAKSNPDPAEAEPGNPNPPETNQ